MTVGVQNHGYAGVAEELLHKLDVDAPAEKQRGARVPQVVETDVGQTRPLQERLEGAGDQVRARYGRAEPGREHKVLRVIGPLVSGIKGYQELTAAGVRRDVLAPGKERRRHGHKPLE